MGSTCPTYSGTNWISESRKSGYLDLLKKEWMVCVLLNGMVWQIVVCMLLDVFKKIRLLHFWHVFKIMLYNIQYSSDQSLLFANIPHLLAKEISI